MINKGGNFNVQEAMKRLQFVIEHLGLTLMEKYPGTQQNKVTCVNFGDLKVRSGGEIYLPTFAVKKEEEDDREYTGSVFVAILARNTAMTLELFDRKTPIEDIKKQALDHLNRIGQSDKFESIEHAYLKDKENIIDLDVTNEEFEKQIMGGVEKTTILPEKVSKEMVFAPGTKIKFYNVKGELVEKTISKTERNLVDKGMTIPLRIYFDDKSFKSFKKDDTFIVTPSAKNSESDKDKMKRLKVKGNNFVGKIYEIGTYSKEKYKGAGASAGGAADFVRIMATSVF